MFFFTINTAHDKGGKLIDEDLHLSVHPFEWWMEKFKEFNCVIHWSDVRKNTSFFYLTAWKDGQEVVDTGKMNVADEEIRKHVEENIKGGWMQATPHETNDFEVMIVGGGPSLGQFENDIREKRASGAKLVTLNGAYNWALEHGLTPSATLVVDAREFNKRFVRPVVDKCLYLIASQCHPAVFEGLPKDRTYIWHPMRDLCKDILDKQYECWYGMPGGSTSLLRAIPLLRMLGYRKFHLYGCDSCIMDDGEHHAYSQPENDSKAIVPVMVTGGRVFRCHLWMAAQAQEFMTMIKMLGDVIELEVYGDGLLAHILKTGEEIATLEEQCTTNEVKEDT